jgi:hypothetical protein
MTKVDTVEGILATFPLPFKDDLSIVDVFLTFHSPTSWDSSNYFTDGPCYLTYLKVSARIEGEPEPEGDDPDDGSYLLLTVEVEPTEEQQNTYQSAARGAINFLWAMGRLTDITGEGIVVEAVDDDKPAVSNRTLGTFVMPARYIKHYHPIGIALQETPNNAIRDFFRGRPGVLGLTPGTPESVAGAVLIQPSYTTTFNFCKNAWDSVEYIFKFLLVDGKQRLGRDNRKMVGDEVTVEARHNPGETAQPEQVFPKGILNELFTVCADAPDSCCCCTRPVLLVHPIHAADAPDLCCSCTRSVLLMHPTCAARAHDLCC